MTLPYVSLLIKSNRPRIETILYIVMKIQFDLARFQSYEKRAQTSLFVYQHSVCVPNADTVISDSTLVSLIVIDCYRSYYTEEAATLTSIVSGFLHFT